MREIVVVMVEIEGSGDAGCPEHLPDWEHCINA